MLTHPTSERLAALGLAGMAKALEEQRENRTVGGLSFEERLALLVDRETAERETKRLAKRLKTANLRQDAIIEDFDPTTKRTLDKALLAKLATGEWIRRRQDLIVTAKTGLGKSWLACALAHKACRDDRSAVYWRVPNLLDELALARGDGRLRRRIKALGAVDVLVLDDWGLAPMTSAQGRDILELIDDRHGRRSTIVTSQVPVRYASPDESGKVIRRYRTNACSNCQRKGLCTPAKERRISRWEHEGVLETVQARLDRTPEKMTLRRSTVEHPFGTIKCWMGATHFLCRTLPKVKTEMALNVLAYNMRRVLSIVGVHTLIASARPR